MFYSKSKVGQRPDEEIALPTSHLTIECRMVEQKKPPLTAGPRASEGGVVMGRVCPSEADPTRWTPYHSGCGCNKYELIRTQAHLTPTLLMHR